MAEHGTSNSSSGEARLVPLGSHASAPPIPITRPATLVGSRKDIVRLHLESSTVSKAHCVIVLNDWGCYVHDLGSRTHTWVNGQQVTDADLNDGDLLQIGRFQFRYEAQKRTIGVPRSAPEAELQVSTLTDPLPITKRVVQIGRRTGSDLQFDDDAVSNVHAILFERNGKRYVRDVGSRKGTWLNGKPIHQEELVDGAEMRVGPATITLNEVSADVGIAPSPATPLPLPVPPAFVRPEPPQISKPAPIELEPVAEVDAPLELELDLDEDLAADPGVAPLSDEAIAAELNAPAEDAVDAVEIEPLQLEIDLPEEPASEDALELAPESSADSDDDALAALRRGWHGAARVEPSLDDPKSSVEEPSAEIDALPQPIEPEPAEPEADASIAVESEALAEAEVVQPEAAVEPEIAEPLAPVEDVSDDDGAIDLDEAPPMPVAESLVEPDLPLESDAAGLTPTDDVESAGPPAELPAVEAAVEDAIVEADTDLDELETGEVVTPAVSEVATPEPVADEAEDEIDPPAVEEIAEAAVSASPAIEAEVEPVAESPAMLPDEAIVDESTPEPALGEVVEPIADAETPADSAIEIAAVQDDEEVVVDGSTPDAALDLVEESAIAEEGELAVEPMPVESAITDDEASADDVDIEAIVDEPISEADVDAELDLRDPAEPSLEDAVSAETPLEEIAEATVEEPAAIVEPAAGIELDEAPEAEADAELDGVASPVSTTARDEALAELDLLDEAPLPTEEEAGLAIDLSQARFDVAGESTDADEGEPEPVAELEDIDFSDIEPGASEAVIEDDNGGLNLSEANFAEDTALDVELADADDADATLEEPPPVVKAPPSPSDFDGFDDDDAPVAPLINLADSLPGDGVPSVEIVEETQPTPASAMPELIDEEIVDEEIDAEDLIHELDIAGEPIDGLPESEGGDPIETTGETGGNVPGAVEGAGDDIIEDEFDLEGLISPPRAGDLRDLIPRDGPMLGGAFSPQPQTFLVGGSPIVEVSPKNASADDADAPGAAAKAPRPAGPPPESGEAAGDDRRKPLRVGFNGGGAAPVAPANPFAGANRTIADTIIGRRGGQSVDVFANPSPTPEDLLLDEAAEKKPDAEGGAAPAIPQTSEQQELLDTAGRFRPRGAISALESFPQANLPPTYRKEDDPIYVAQLRRGRIRSVLFCFLAMFLLLGGVVYGVQHFVPVYSKLVAAITYDGLAKLEVERARNFKHGMNVVLSDENIRLNALAELGPEWEQKKGFLADTQRTVEALVRTPGERWPAAQPNQMHLIVMSRDKEDDLARLRALAKAVVKSSEDNVRRVARLREESREDEAQIQALDVRLKAVVQEIEELRAVGEARPDGTKMDEVEARRKAAETELKAARTARLDLEAAIELLEKQSTAELAPSPEADLSKADEELGQLTAQLEAIQKQSESLKASAASRNVEARKAMDAVINQFQADVENAQKLKDSPELVAYVDGAKRYFSKTRQLTDALIRKQEILQTRLSETKEILAKRMEERTRELLDKDSDLKRLNDELAMFVRQQNAAISQGLKEEADKLSLQMQQHRLLIATREDLFKNDMVHTEAISMLEQIIEQTKKSIQDDRRDIDATLTQEEQAFARNAPAVDKLPGQQKELAVSIEKRLAAVTEARRAYAAAADAAEAEQAKAEAESKEKIANIQLEIRARKQMIEAAAREKQAVVAEENRKKRLGDRRAELTAAIEKEKQGKALLDSFTAEKERMEEHRRRLVQNDELFLAKNSSKDDLDRQIRSLRFRVEEKQKQIASVIVPDPKVDIQNFDSPDRRTLYTGLGVGAVFLLMSIPIAYNLRLISRDSHHPAPAPSADPEATAAKTNGFTPIFNDPAAVDDDVSGKEKPEANEPVTTR